MELNKLFEMQKKLDAEIELKHPVQPGEDRLEKRRLALLVELGELANEVRFFKFWSVDQELRPKTLEEYVDCLHFFLSFGIATNNTEIELCKFEKAKEPKLSESFRKIFDFVSSHNFNSKVNFTYAFSRFIQLGEILGFDKQQIFEAYMSKNLVNYQRQESGY